MKIVSWNCNGKFREKYKFISKLDAEIYIIQECENPSIYVDTDYSRFATNYLWTGENDKKGLGIFAKNNVDIKDNHWETYCLRNFISVKINNDFDLVGVWACKPYIEEYYIYQNINLCNINKNTIIIGDFNSNQIWDNQHEKRNHTTVVNELKYKGLVSAYHFIKKENQGEETENTFYMYRHLDKGYHIDHCFILENRIKEYHILSDKEWIDYSDHIPLLLEI